MPEAQHQPARESQTGAPSPEKTVHAIGAQLEAQRKARGISVVEVSEHTKISRKYLEALEAGRFEELPGETYIRGFLRAYAQYLELDDEKLIEQYLACLGRGRQDAEHECPDEDEEREVSNQSLWGPLLAVLALAGLGAGLFLVWPSGESTPPAVEQPAAGAASASLDPLAPISGDMTLKIRAKMKTWITIMVDGRQGPDITLEPNEERTWTAKERFVLWTGNAGGIEVYFNGVLQPPLGEVNEVRKEVIFERPADTPPAPVLE
mgnify:CR=1 FL=1